MRYLLNYCTPYFILALAFVAAAQIQLPKREIAFIFDDGHRSVIDQGYYRQGLPGAFYVADLQNKTAISSARHVAKIVRIDYTTGGQVTNSFEPF